MRNSNPDKDVYVFVEQREGKIQNVGLELLGKAHELASILKQDVVALWLGNDIEKQSHLLIAAGADCLVSGDKDPLAVADRYAILTPADFCARHAP